MYDVIKDILRRSLLEISIIFIISIGLIIVIGKLYPELKIYYNVLYLFAVSFSLETIILKYYKIKNSIDRDLLYYISYIYSLSFSTYNIKNLLDISIQEEKDFKEINSYMKRVLDLVKKYNYTIPEAIRYILSYVPKSNFKSFLERFATSIDIGQDLSDFLYKEYENAMSLYDTEYKKGLENIRLLQEFILSLLSSLSFAFSLVLFIPFLISYNIYILLLDFGIIFFIINIMIYYLSKYYIPDDDLWAKAKEKPKEYEDTKKLFYILVLLSYVLALSLFFVEKLPLLEAISIGIAPLTYISYKMINLERILKVKENHFPAFFSSIIEYSEIFGNNQVKILDDVIVHDYSLLNEDIEKLRRRITITKNYEESWRYFITELGSRLAEKIIRVFEKVLEYNGDTKKAGNMLYDILIKIIELRNRKSQFVSNLRGIIYGTYIAFAAILFIIAQIIYSMENMFQGISTALGSSTVSEIGINFFSFNLPLSFLNNYISILLFFQAIALALALKNIQGGSKLGIFLDITILVWIAALLDIGVFYFFTHVLSGLSIIKS
ncbi:archaeal flagellar protein FlaJ [Nanobdella aerobiophila]|uniref:Archaeal flagellar protein FlaJ n=1 Tax=Nanobdella aerobiophila TaxID=2586965 RepID=A0A915SAD5_9ARCH|nr:hypothetical protein [Nanobdella aerobiophila]BBL45682.1 archaeal flagellar protein FlaJ [Nanobdella aerobiophila]